MSNDSLHSVGRLEIRLHEITTVISRDIMARSSGNVGVKSTLESIVYQRGEKEYKKCVGIIDGIEKELGWLPFRGSKFKERLYQLLAAGGGVFDNILKQINAIAADKKKSKARDILWEVVACYPVGYEVVLEYFKLGDGQKGRAKEVIDAWKKAGSNLANFFAACAPSADLDPAPRAFDGEGYLEISDLERNDGHDDEYAQMAVTGATSLDPGETLIAEVEGRVPRYAVPIETDRQILARSGGIVGAVRNGQGEVIAHGHPPDTAVYNGLRQFYEDHGPILFEAYTRALERVVDIVTDGNKGNAALDRNQFIRDCCASMSGNPDGFRIWLRDEYSIEVPSVSELL